MKEIDDFLRMVYDEAFLAIETGIVPEIKDVIETFERLREKYPECNFNPKLEEKIIISTRQLLNFHLS